MIHTDILNIVGNTPMVQLKTLEEPIKLFAKLEFYNPTGSMKDRAAIYIINKLFEIRLINQQTTIIESSSGNFGISLASMCKKKNLKFICVIDPNISPINEMLLNQLGAQVVKVKKGDNSGGYLLSRIQKVQEICSQIDNSYWINQYENRYNAEAYYHSLGREICEQVKNIDYVFMGVSSGGTITGVSNMIKKCNPKTKVIAVDIYGSVIFGHKPSQRFIPGIGSSIVPKIIKRAKIDEVIMIDELASIYGCRELLKDHFIFSGGSSGSVYSAVKKYFKNYITDKPINIVTILPDRGDRYFNTIYNDLWVSKMKRKLVDNMIKVD